MCCPPPFKYCKNIQSLVSNLKADALAHRYLGALRIPMCCRHKECHLFEAQSFASATTCSTLSGSMSNSYARTCSCFRPLYFNLPRSFLQVIEVVRPHYVGVELDEERAQKLMSGKMYEDKEGRGLLGLLRELLHAPGVRSSPLHVPGSVLEVEKGKSVHCIQSPQAPMSDCDSCLS
jgi:hypothetical protein